MPTSILAMLLDIFPTLAGIIWLGFRSLVPLQRMYDRVGRTAFILSGAVTMIVVMFGMLFLPIGIMVTAQ